MKEQYHLVSFSGGKDSTAMLLGMLEREWTAAGKPIRSRAFYTALRERLEASR